MARPKLQIDPEQVIKLAAINCSNAEMAAVLDCSHRVLERRFAAIIKKGRTNGRMSLKRKQWELAMSGNVTMLIWLGKIILKQRETPKDFQHVTINNQQTSPQLDEAIRKINELMGVKAECSSPQNKPLTLKPPPGF